MTGRVCVRVLAVFYLGPARSLRSCSRSYGRARGCARHFGVVSGGLVDRTSLLFGKTSARCVIGDVGAVQVGPNPASSISKVGASKAWGFPLPSTLLGFLGSGPKGSFGRVPIPPARVINCFSTSTPQQPSQREVGQYLFELPDHVTYDGSGTYFAFDIQNYALFGGLPPLDLPLHSGGLRDPPPDPQRKIRTTSAVRTGCNPYRAYGKSLSRCTPLRCN